MKNKKYNWLFFGIPLAVGGYFLYRSMSNKAKKDKVKDDIDDSQTSDAVKEKQKEQAAFPLKRGSKGKKVIELQNALLVYNPKILPKFGNDGDFGSETESAVKSVLGKSTVDSQEEIAKILDLAAKEKQSQEARAATQKLVTDRNNLAKVLLNAWTASNKSTKFVAIHDTQATVETKETITNRTLSTETKVYKRGETLAGYSNILNVSIATQGFLLIEVASGSRGVKKFIRVSPFGVYLKK
jgi:monoamine oxidase